jgi:molybdenum cofactor cytidylyltransferase
MIDGKTMLRRSVEAVIAAGIDPIIVVTGHESEQIRAALDGLFVRFAHAALYAEGMAASLRVGMETLPQSCAGVLICLADMPFVRAATLRMLADEYDPAGPWVALVPVFKKERGNPVLLGRPLFREVAELTGDQGARGLLAAIPERVREIRVDDQSVLRDIDRPESLRR